MRNPFRRRRNLRVVIASQRLGEVRRALDTLLEERNVRWDLLGEPRSTEGVYRLVNEQPRLVVVDPPAELLGEMDWTLVEETLARGGIPWALAADFLAEPGPWIERALVAQGAIEALLPRAAAFVAYSGGVGKTTITLDTAVAFAAHTRLPVLAVEICHGASAFHTFCDPDLPDFFACAAEGQPPGVWRGVTMVPMNADHTADLPPGQVQGFLSALAGRHTLTLLDVSGYPHFMLNDDPLAVDQWWIVACAGRSDTLDNAAYLRQKRPDARVLVNQAGRLNPGAWGFPHEAELPQVRRVDRFEGRLGAEMLRHIYPGWRR